MDRGNSLCSSCSPLGHEVDSEKPEKQNLSAASTSKMSTTTHFGADVSIDNPSRRVCVPHLTVSGDPH